jgi:hypothetical protein
MGYTENDWPACPQSLHAVRCRDYVMLSEGWVVVNIPHFEYKMDMPVLEKVRQHLYQAFLLPGHIQHRELALRPHTPGLQPVPLDAVCLPQEKTV